MSKDQVLGPHFLLYFDQQKLRWFWHYCFNNGRKVAFCHPDGYASKEEAGRDLTLFGQFFGSVSVYDEQGNNLTYP